jgi:hypothetical protein
MSSKPAIKSVFAPLKPSAVAKVAEAASPSSAPTNNAARWRDLLPPKDGQETLVRVQFWFEVVDRPDRLCPAWAYCGDPRKIEQFGKRIGVNLNIAHWPVTEAVKNKDWQTLRWLVAIAILERLIFDCSPLLRAISRRLAETAFDRHADIWERGLWAAYRLKDHPFMTRLESIPLVVGTARMFSELDVRVNNYQLAAWKARLSAKLSRAAN